MMPGQELAVLCHPSKRRQAEEFAEMVAGKLTTDGEKIAVVADKDCPRHQVFIVNRDYYDAFTERPWTVMS